MVRNVIFDVGDTLTMYQHDREWSKRLLAEEYGVPLECIQAFFREYLTAGDAVGGMTLREFWPQHTTDLGPIPLEAVERAAQRHADDKIVNSAMVKLLVHLKPRYRLFALTNTWGPEHYRRKELASYFEAFVQSSDSGFTKPDPATYRSILDMYHLKPDETLFINNHEAHVDGARRLGMRALHFTSRDGLVEDLRQLGVAMS